MSSASEVSPTIQDSQDRADLAEIHNCVRDTLATLDVEGVEFFIELDGETLKLTLQTKQFLEAQDLAVKLGKNIEQIAPANLLGLAVYKRKNADTKAFLIKEMSLVKNSQQEIKESAKIPAPATKTKPSVSKSSPEQSIDPQSTPNNFIVDPSELHQCALAILANLNIKNLECFTKIEGEIVSIIVQTKEFLPAQELAVELGQSIEKIAPDNILEVAVYKRKHAEAQAFLIKKMALKKQGEAEPEYIPEIPVTIPDRQYSLSSSTKEPLTEYRPKLRMYGMLNSYLLRTFSGFFALGVGICVVYGGSRFLDSMEQKPLTYIDVNQLPGLGTTRNDPEVMEYQVSFPRGTHISKFLVYLPTQPTKPKLPCILIAPSGRAPLYGQTLEQMSQWEYRHYAKAGYAVIAYDVDGAIEQMSEANQTALLMQPNQTVTARLRAYKAADGGVLNAKLAIDYAIARIPQIDPNAIYTAGSGSGGTLALMVAATDKRVKGAIAYTPVTNIPKKFPNLIDNISKVVPKYSESIEKFSPYQNAAKITKPLFIFQDDISTVNSIEDTNEFVELVSKSNTSVTFAHAPVTPFFRSDLPSEGVKKAIEWLNNQ